MYKRSKGFGQWVSQSYDKVVQQTNVTGQLPGRLEQHSTMRHHLDFYKNVGVTAYYRNSSPISLKQRIHGAVAAVIKSHPILSAIPIDESTKNPYFARLPNVNLENCVEFFKRQRPYIGDCSDPELDGVLATQHNKNFKSLYGTRPVWRLVVLLNSEDETSFAACFIYHHSIGDGTSGKAFHKTFLDSVSSESAPLSSTIVPSFDGPLLPELEKLHPLPLSLTTLVKGFYHDTFSTPSQNLWSGGPISTPMVSQFRSLTILPVKSSDFAATCRREKTTVSATLQTLLAASLFKHLPEHYSQITSTMAISLRRWMPPPVTEDAMGNWVASLEAAHQRQAFSWDEARRCRQLITKFLAQDGKDTNTGLLRWLSDYKHHFVSKLGTKRAISFEISNIGTWPSRESTNVSGWEIGRVVFSQSESVTGGAIQLCIVSGGDGSMTLGYACQEGVVDDKLIEQVMEDMESQIKILSDSS